jgi:hypothetical protein
MIAKIRISGTKLANGAAGSPGRLRVGRRDEHAVETPCDAGSGRPPVNWRAPYLWAIPMASKGPGPGFGRPAGRERGGSAPAASRPPRPPGVFLAEKKHWGVRPAGRPLDEVDPGRAGGQHHQPVETQRDPAGGWHGRERRQKILVERIALSVDPLLFVHLRLEAAPLLGRVGEFPEPVRKLHPAGIKLEAFRHARVVRAGPRERRLRDRIAVERRRPALPEPGLDLRHEKPREEIGPALALARRHPRRRQRRTERPHRQASPSGRRPRTSPPPPPRSPVPARHRGRKCGPGTGTPRRPPPLPPARGSPRNPPSAARRAPPPDTIRAW